MAVEVAAVNWTVILGLAGVVISGLAYRRAGALKNADRRLDLRRLDLELLEIVPTLPALADLAKESRENAWKRAGMGQYLIGWMPEWARVRTGIHQLEACLPAPEATYRWFWSSKLETELVARGDQLRRAKDIRDKLNAWMAADGYSREQILASRAGRGEMGAM